MKVVAVIQARMASTRLPGKVLADVAGQPMLAQQIRRLKTCLNLDDLVIATTVNSTDEPIVEFAKREGIDYIRGSEQDVLSRFVEAARHTKADVVVRLTADCPLIDPGITDQVIQEIIEHAHECDYASNVIKRSYPRGLDVEAFFVDTLFRMDRLARSALAREHVTVFLRSEHTELFLMRDIVDTADNTDLRWTVDSPVDLELIRLLYSSLGLGEQFTPYPEILSYVRKHPELVTMNTHVETWTPGH
jgi:spore coat polysaccharide biosynthesis protein SpsF